MGINTEVEDIKPLLKIKSGDIIKLFQEDYFDIIIQGCNCFSLDGGGLAGQISKEYPDILQKSFPSFISGDYNQLGNHSIYYLNKEKTKAIINVYSQYLPGEVKSLIFLYNALELFFENFIRNHSKDLCKLRIGIPQIGAGIAGGDWRIIEYIINQNINIYNDITETEMDITLVNFDQTITT